MSLGLSFIQKHSQKTFLNLNFKLQHSLHNVQFRARQDKTTAFNNDTCEVVSSLAVPRSIPLRMSTGQKSKINISTGVWGR